jgi:hypothetical protein
MVIEPPCSSYDKKKKKKNLANCSLHDFESTYCYVLAIFGIYFVLSKEYEEMKSKNR